MAEDKEPGTALVTGAGRRLGRAIALDLARAGWRIGVHCHASKADALDLVAEIERGGGQAAPLVADLARTEALAPLVEACAERLGPPTLLVNNAARFAWDSIATLDEASWDAHLDVNLRAPVFLAQAFASTLPEGTKGQIINLLDQKIFRLNPEFFSYTVAKSALLAATTMLAQRSRSASGSTPSRRGPCCLPPRRARRRSRRNAGQPRSGVAWASTRFLGRCVSCSPPPPSPARPSCSIRGSI